MRSTEVIDKLQVFTPAIIDISTYESSYDIVHRILEERGIIKEYRRPTNVMINGMPAIFRKMSDVEMLDDIFKVNNTSFLPSADIGGSVTDMKKALIRTSLGGLKNITDKSETYEESEKRKLGRHIKKVAKMAINLATYMDPTNWTGADRNEEQTKLHIIDHCGSYTNLIPLMSHSVKKLVTATLSEL